MTACKKIVKNAYWQFWMIFEHKNNREVEKI